MCRLRKYRLDKLSSRWVEYWPRHLILISISVSIWQPATSRAAWELIAGLVLFIIFCHDLDNETEVNLVKCVDDT